MPIPKDFDSPPPGMLGVVSFDPNKAIERTFYGINEFGNRTQSDDEIKRRIAYVDALDATPGEWVDEFWGFPSEEMKAFGRWGIINGRFSTQYLQRLPQAIVNIQ